MFKGLRRHAVHLLLGATFVAAGCHPLRTTSYCLPTSEIPIHAPPGIPCVPEGEVTLAQLLDVAAANHPDIAVARARSEAARGQLIQAGLYPSPAIGWAASDINDPNASAGKQGPMIVQTILAPHKLRFAQRAAEAGVVAMDWQAMTRWFDVVMRVRFAFYDVLTAQGEMQVNRELLKLAEDALTAAKKLQDAGAGTQPDILRAQVEVELTQVRLVNSEQRARAAWKILAIAIGVPDMPHRQLVGTLEGEIPAFEWEPVARSVLTRSSEIHEAEALVAQAYQQLRRAQIQPLPDLRLQVNPYHSFPDRNAQLAFQATADIPLWNHNQGNIATARADVDRTREEVRQVELRLSDRLTLAFQRYRQARETTEMYRKKVVPTALESLKLVRRGYSQGDPKYDFTTVLQAQQVLSQARLAYVQALGSLWRAVSEIQALLQEPPESTSPSP